MTFPSGQSMSKNELDPWRVIVSCVFDGDSYEIPGIIDGAGLRVDWRLTEREGYSHKYRKAAYRPRVHMAYEALGGDDRLRVAFSVSRELARRGLAEVLNVALHQIGWRIDGDNLVPATETVRELFFPGGTQHDAYVHIRQIVRRARRSLSIIDPYLDGSVFTIIREIDGLMTVHLLSRSCNTNPTNSRPVLPMPSSRGI